LPVRVRQAKRVWRRKKIWLLFVGERVGDVRSNAERAAAGRKWPVARRRFRSAFGGGGKCVRNWAGISCSSC